MIATKTVRLGPVTASAAQTDFAYSGKVFTETDWNIWVLPVGTTTWVPKTFPGDFSVTNVGTEAGEIQFVTGLTAGDKVVGVANVPGTQQISLAAWPQIEEQLDRVTRQLNFIEDKLLGGLFLDSMIDRLAEPSLVSPVALEILRWNAAADGVESVLASAVNLATAVDETSDDTAKTKLTSDFIAANAIQDRKNKLINGNFDIWQRGTSFNTSVYTSDRWLLSLGAGAAITASRQNFTVGQIEVPGNPRYFVDLNRATAGTASSLLSQKIENVRLFSGKTVTMSFWAKASAALSLEVDFQQSFGSGGGSAGVNGPNLGGFAVTTAWQKFSVQIPVDSIAGKTIGSGEDDYTQFSFIWRETQGPTETLSIAQVQVEEGSVATPFEQRPLAEEVGYCQRFYEKSFSFNQTPVEGGTNHHYITVGAVTATARRAFIPFRTRKRAIPAITYYRPAAGAVAASWAVRESLSAWTDRAASSDTITESGVTISLVAVGAVAGEGMVAQGHWVADAEL